MSGAPSLWHLYCPRCHQRERSDFVDRWRRLRDLGMLLREKEPTPELVDSLADAKLSFFVCGHCGQSGLQREDDPEQDHGWPEAKPCRGCSARIPVERLELFPNTQYCAQCQATIDRGETPEAEREFCSRCGEVLRHRARQRGIATYELYCPACGRS